MALEDIEKRINIKDLRLDPLPPKDAGDRDMAERAGADFYIEIDFQKGKGNPSRVFRVMSDLIDALQSTDQSLIKSIGAKLEPVLLLEDVESGSVRAWLKQAIESIDDEGLKEADWKKIVGAYLVRSKYLIINFLDKKTDIKGTQEIEALERDINKLAEATDVKRIPAYQPISREALVRDIAKINEALAPLNDDDKAILVAGEEKADFNLTLHIAPETIEDLITSETIPSVAEMILKVKKPDFLGTSQWELRHDNRTLLAKILDEDWLKRFQAGEVLVKPGDAIRGQVVTEVKYGFDREVVAGVIKSGTQR
ncbi:MAG: hypothetical protein ACR2G4_06420 [Pyrinomonadaceae bacterium]